LITLATSQPRASLDRHFTMELCLTYSAADVMPPGEQSATELPSRTIDDIHVRVVSLTRFHSG
jgi:hypothetical protein